MWPTRDGIRANLVAQTAELRWSVKSEGFRRLLRQKGYDPARCIQGLLRLAGTVKDMPSDMAENHDH